MQKVWIATELFYPEETSTSYILTKIANRISQKYEVEVVCGIPVYDKNSNQNNEFTVSENIKINRLKGLEGNKNSLLFRMLRFMQLSLQIFFFLKKNMQKGDKLFIVTNPAPLIVLCSWLKKFKKFEWIILVHDVFPENTIPAGILKSKQSFVYKFLKRIFDKAYSRADKIIVLGRDMKDIIQQKITGFPNNSQIEVIENWGAVDFIFPVQKSKNFHEKFIIQYGGNVGRVQGLKNLIEKLVDSKNDQIVLHIIGEGAVKKELMQYVQQNGIKNVLFQGSYRRSEQNDILNSCDLALVTVAEGMYGLGVPSKTYNILAAGKPILFIGPKNSEIDLLIRENNIGFSFESQDIKRITCFFKSLQSKSSEEFKQMSENSRRIALEQYSEAIILNKFINFI